MCKTLVALAVTVCVIVGGYYEYECDCPLAIEVSDEVRDYLYRIAWAEARGEGEKGIILVINVILNRVADPNFPDTIRDVIFQPRQFSPVQNGAFARAIPCDYIKNAVQRALDGVNYSRGALFFRAICCCLPGSWHERNLTRLFDHKGHRFYR